MGATNYTAEAKAESPGPGQSTSLVAGTFACRCGGLLSGGPLK